MKPRWCVFISGRGSNLQSLIDTEAGFENCVLVLSNSPQALGLLRAKRMGIPTQILPTNKDKKLDWDKIIAQLKQQRISHVFLLGFMRLVPAKFCEAFKTRVFNIHPSLLPQFPGLDAIENSHKAGGAMGVTVHEVIAEMDAGPVLLQKQCTANSGLISLQEAKIKIALTERSLVQKLSCKLHSRAHDGLQGWGNVRN